MRIEWYNWADEVAESPGLVDGYGFSVASVEPTFMNIDVYEFTAHDPLKPGKVCSLYVKWDGCSHLNVDDGSCFHLCGSRDWASKMELIRECAFKLASERMERFDPETADYTPGRAVTRLKNDLMPEELP